MSSAQIVSPQQDGKTRTRHFILLLSIWSLLVSMVTRGYVLAEAPLPPVHPVPWIIGALAEDMAILGALAIVALLLPRFRGTQLAARIFFGVCTVAITVLQIVRAEAVIFFGEAVRPEDLHRDVRVTVLVQSLSGAAATLLIITALTLPFVLWLWERTFGEQRAARVIRFAVLIGLVTFTTACGALAERYVGGEGLARNPVVALAMIESELRVASSTRFESVRPQMPLTAIRDFIPDDIHRSYFDQDYPLAYLPGTIRLPIDVPPDVKPNIVIVLMESVRAGEIGAYGGQPANLTPNLDALARNGIRVDDMYSSGTYTASAELALWYGLPPVPREILITSRPSIAITGLPEILRSAGWKTMLWLHGGNLDFYRRDLFYLPRGFRVVDARAFPKDDPTTNWGYSDRALARHANTVLTRAEEPFAAMLLTVTNHHMFQLPSDSDPPILLPPHHSDAEHVRTDEMLQTVHYTDEAVGDFMRNARKQPWFAHTIFVFTGDHGITVPPFDRRTETPQELTNLLHRVPLIIYSPMIKKPMVLHGPATHIDVMPTLLALAGVLRPRTGLGVNLFRVQENADRIVPMWGSHGRNITLVSQRYDYDASYASDGPLESQEPKESVTDRLTDPSGTHNAINEIPPDALARFRHLRDVYVELYPWLVINGRSGLPAQKVATR